MNLMLWIVAGLLAAVFTVGSTSKLFIPKAKLAAAPAGGWVEDFSAEAIRAVGAVEVLAAVGLVLPAALDIAPMLVPLAAVGVVLLMIGAVITRLRSSHVAKATVLVDLSYLAMAAFVAWGRFGPEPF
jgi:hypothetical protein